MTAPASPPVDRLASRVLLLDREGRVLLFQGCDPTRPEAGTWWFTPGGGRDPGESAQECAARELREETGLVLAPDALGQPVHERLTVFPFEGVTYRQSEQYFAVRVEAHDVDTAGFSDLEQRSVLAHRWWRPEALRTAADAIYPEELADLLGRLAC
jgi:8-oxo-dGTP pyrophosphatase MutT (NUDIX family)